MNRSLVSLRSASVETRPTWPRLWTDVLRRVGPEDQATDVEP